MKERPEWCSMLQFRPRSVLLLFISLLLLFLTDRASGGSKVRGIDPQDLTYFQDNTIWCKDGSKAFPRDRLNDNFCDCADGTDEPGTSACPASKYFCQNAGSVSKFLYSSRVNDGICDCCDGSDEYEKRVKCANTCGGAISESTKLDEDLANSSTFNANGIFENNPDQQTKLGEDLVSKLRDMKGVVLLLQWLPLFSLLCLLGWMWARVPRRLNLKRKKGSRPALV